MSKNKTKILNELNDSFLNENQIIFKKYKPIKVIGFGSFGKIYSTIRIEDKSTYAMKTEKRNPLKKILETEAYYLFTLQGFGFPKLISFGHTKNYNILIETLLGKSLYDIFIKAKKTCNLTNICLIAIQLIERLKFIHSKDIIYRDVKPENFMIGIKDPNVIYIVDFGLCKKYRSSKTGKHLLPKDTKKFQGTLKYASSNVVKGKETSRRDDMISLGYVLIYLYKRNLPWKSEFKSLNRETYYETIDLKETNDSGKLFDGLPEEMVNYIKYTKNLKFEEEPDYEFMKGCFQKILIRLNLNINKINFTWIDANDKNIKKVSNHSERKTGSRYRILKSLEKKENEKQYKPAKKRLFTQTESDLVNNNYICKTSINLEEDIVNQDYLSNILNTNELNDNKKKIINGNNKYIKDEQKKKKIFKMKNIDNTRNKTNILSKNNNSLINENQIRNNKNINNQNNIYINNNNNNNIFLNIGNINKKSLNNKIGHRKIHTINTDYELKENNTKKYYISNNSNYSLKLNGNINKLIYNNNANNTTYVPYFLNNKTNNILDSQSNNNFKIYKSKIYKDKNNNYIINNKKFYSGNYQAFKDKNNTII